MRVEYLNSSHSELPLVFISGTKTVRQFGIISRNICPKILSFSDCMNNDYVYLGVRYVKQDGQRGP